MAVNLQIWEQKDFLTLQNITSAQASSSKNWTNQPIGGELQSLSSDHLRFSDQQSVQQDYEKDQTLCLRGQTKHW